MASIQTVPITRFRSNELLTFGRALETKLQDSDFAEAPTVASQLTAYKDALQKLDDSVITGGKSLYTTEMENADKKRDHLQSGFLGQIQIFQNHFDTTKQAAAVRLSPLADKYKGKTEKSYEEQTSITANLIQEAQSDTYATDIATLGLTEWITALKESNDACASLSAERISEKGAQKSLPKLADTRPVFIEAYNTLAKRFNALAEVNGDADYVELFTWWNALIDRDRLLLANRLGAGKGGTTDNGNSNQPDPGTGSEEEEEGGGNDGERPGGL